MVVRTFATTLVGIEAQFVQVEVDISPGLPGIHIVGLPDAAVAESVHRVRSALRSLDFPLPPRRITINLAPGDLRKEGPRFDLAVALAILGAAKELAGECLQEMVVLGELGLDGRLVPVRGVLNTALALSQRGFRHFVVPHSNFVELPAGLELEIWPAQHLREVVSWLKGEARPCLSRQNLSPRPPEPTSPNLDQVMGLELGRRALEVAAAGGHHLLWVGPPGCGKTLLSRCLPQLLPDLNEQQRLEVGAVQSALGQGQGLSCRPPLAEPHCRISAAALLGSMRPGEVSRAHAGVLFLDEVVEFSRDGLEGLRVALETGWIEVGRVRQVCRFPARFQLIAACNPCPCGYFGDLDRGCSCPEHRRLAYLGRLSGPIRDRLDLQVQLQRPNLRSGWQGAPGSTELARRRVSQARQLQAQRGCLNRDLPRAFFQRGQQVELAGWDFFFDYAESQHLSARAAEKLLRIARTLADLEPAPPGAVAACHLEEAVHFRSLDRSL